MMSCYVEVVKQVTVLVVTTCESVNSHLLLSPCTALELATCTLQKSFPKIYHQFLSVSLAVQLLKRSTFSGIHPIPIFQLTIEGGGKLGPTRTHKAKVESNFWE